MKNKGKSEKVTKEIIETILDMTNNFNVGGVVLEAIEVEIAAILEKEFGKK